MSLLTYSDLQTAVTNWTHRADLTTIIPDLITVAETRIFRELRVYEMETVFASTITASGTIALPATYVALKNAYITASPYGILERKTAKWIYEKYPTRTSSNRPRFIAREGSNFIFGPYPDSQYTVGGTWYKNRGPLSASNHSVFLANPDLYLFGTLLEAAPYLKNDVRIAVWQAKYTQAAIEAQVKSDKEDVSGSDLRMTSA